MRHLKQTVLKDTKLHPDPLPRGVACFCRCSRRLVTRCDINVTRVLCKGWSRWSSRCRSTQIAPASRRPIASLCGATSRMRGVIFTLGTSSIHIRLLQSYWHWPLERCAWNCPKIRCACDSIRSICFVQIPASLI